MVDRGLHAQRFVWPHMVVFPTKFIQPTLQVRLRWPILQRPLQFAMKALHLTLRLRMANPRFVEICEGLWASAEVWKGKAESMKPVSTKAGVIPYRIIQSGEVEVALIDRKSTRLNSSHLGISY